MTDLRTQFAEIENRLHSKIEIEEAKIAAIKAERRNRLGAEFCDSWDAFVDNQIAIFKAGSFVSIFKDSSPVWGDDGDGSSTYGPDGQFTYEGE